MAQKWHSKSAYSTTSEPSSEPRTWSSAASGGSGALPRSVTASGARLDGVEAVEDQVRAGEVPGTRGLMAPLHHGVRVGDHQRALGEPGLVVDPEGPAGRALGLEVRQLRDVDPELLAEGVLRPRGVAGDAEEPGAAGLEFAQHLVVDVELVGAHGAEGERVEDQHGRLPPQIVPGERLPLLGGEPELWRRRAGRDRAHLRRPSSLTSDR